MEIKDFPKQILGIPLKSQIPFTKHICVRFVIFERMKLCT